MDTLVDILHEGHHSLVVGGSTVSKYDGRGVADLYRLSHDNPALLHGASIADKVVGKGAAALMVWAKVGEVYADVVSSPALDLLENNGIPVTYATLVPHIVNRTGTGMCPLETRCLPCATVEECLVQIETFIEEMKQKNNRLDE